MNINDREGANNLVNSKRSHPNQNITAIITTVHYQEPSILAFQSETESKQIKSDRNFKMQN